MDVHSVAKILHGLAEDCVIEKFEKVLFEAIGGRLAFFGIIRYVWFQSC